MRSPAIPNVPIALRRPDPIPSPPSTPPPTWNAGDRPCLAATIELTEVTQRGVPVVVIKNPPGLTYFQVSVPVAATIRLFDGTRTVEQVARDAAPIMGAEVTIEDVLDLLRKIHAYGFLEGSPPVRRDPVRWRRIFAWRAWEFETSDRFERLARLFAPVFDAQNKRLLAAAFLALFGVFVYVVSQSWSAFQMGMMLWSRWEYVVAWIGLIMFTSVFHEAAHAITYINHGGRRPRFGAIVFLGVFVAAFTDVADTYRFNEKWRRISVNLAGIFVNLCFAIPALLYWEQVGGLAGEALFFFGMVNSFMVIFSMLPTFRSDMYYVLVDLSETPNLQQRSVRYVVSKVKRLFGGGPGPERPDGWGQRTLFAGFGALSLAFIIIAWWGMALQITSMSPAAVYLEESSLLGFIPGAESMNKMTVAMDGMSFWEMMAMLDGESMHMAGMQMGDGGMSGMEGMDGMGHDGHMGSAASNDTATMEPSMTCEPAAGNSTAGDGHHNDSSAAMTNESSAGC